MVKIKIKIKEKEKMLKNPSPENDTPEMMNAVQYSASNWWGLGFCLML